MSTAYDALLAQIKKDGSYLLEQRRWLHRHPEIAREEFETQKKIERELDALGIPHSRVGGTGIAAELKGNLEGKKTIVLRADTDALPIQETANIPCRSENPGKMHACGHDVHTASLLGAAKYLAEHKESFGGRVRFVFQPAEEVGYGARAVIREGVLTGADRCFGIHVASNLRAGTIAVVPGACNASCDYVRITVHGVGSHISTPQDGVDALYIASQIVVGSQALITRRISPMDNVLIGFGKLASGSVYNVVPHEAILEGTIRAFKPEQREQVKAELAALAENTAAIYGGTAEVEIRDYASPLINDASCCEEVQKTAIGLFGLEKVITSRTPSLGADDMADFILGVPGCYAYVGSGNPERPGTCLPHHNGDFEVDEDCLFVGAAIYAGYAIDYLNGEG